MGERGSVVMNAADLEVPGVRQVKITPIVYDDRNFVVSTTLEAGVYSTVIRASSGGAITHEFSRHHSNEDDARYFHKNLTDLAGKGIMPPRLDPSLAQDINDFYRKHLNADSRIKGDPKFDFGLFPPELQRRLGKRWKDYSVVSEINDCFGFSDS